MSSKGINIDNQIDRLMGATGSNNGSSNIGFQSVGMMHPSDNSEADHEGDGGINMSPRVLMSKLYCLAGKSKIKSIVDYLIDFLDYKQKFVVFCHHQEVMKGIEDGLSSQNKSKKADENAPLFVKIDGACNSE